MRRRTLGLLVAVPLALAALVVGGTWLYLNVVEDEAPERLTLGGAPTSSAPATPGPAATGSVDGTWRATPDSQVGYRVAEVLFGQATTAVGRTNAVTGELTIAGRTVTGTTFTVDMASVTSDRERRDGQYRDRIMAVGTYPTATFRQTAPIRLDAVPADGATVRAKATGDLTLRGRTRPVTFDVEARRTGARVEVSGSIRIVFAEWGIPDPSFGPARVEDEGDLEFLLVFAR